MNQIASLTYYNLRFEDGSKAQIQTEARIKRDVEMASKFLKLRVSSKVSKPSHTSTEKGTFCICGVYSTVVLFE